MKQTIIYRFPLIAYCIFIFVQSSFPSPEVIPTFAFSDKLLHLVGYALLGALSVRAFKREFKNYSRLKVIIYAIIFSTLYGFSDELHQSMVSVRVAEGMDVLFDFFGSVIGATLFYRDIPYIDDF